MNTALMFSSASDEWSTPREFLEALFVEFGFTFDAAATRSNAVCPEYFGLDEVGGERPRNHGDALASDWDPRHVYWCNPPYSKCREFVGKAWAERLRGVLSVLLVPSRTDTRWFHEYVWDRERHTTRPGVEIRFVKGRLRFGGATAGAPFPSMLIVFRPDPPAPPSEPVTLTDDDKARLVPLLENAIAEVDASVEGGTIFPDDGLSLMAAYDWARGLLRRIWGGDEAEEGPDPVRDGWVGKDGRP